MRKKTEVICPSCHEAIDIQVELDAGGRNTVRDCSICDEPMRLKIWVSEDGDQCRVRAEPITTPRGDPGGHEDEALLEAEVTCPTCWETIELSIDRSVGSQTYSEDCPVCCRPMTVRVTADEDSVQVDVAAENE